MILDKFRLFNKKQVGITMMELTVAFAVSAILSVAVTTTFYQVVMGGSRASAHMTAVTQVETAGYWVSRDAQSAQKVQVNKDNELGFPLVLWWIDWDGVEHNVTYTLEGTELWRDDGVGEMVVARFVDTSPEDPENPDGPKKTYCDFADTNGDGMGDTLILKITSTLGSGSRQQSESKVYKIVPRPLW